MGLSPDWNFGMYGPNMPHGMVRPGNIDIYNRPIARNPDGSISTVRSMGFGLAPGAEALLPSVSGYPMSPHTGYLMNPDQSWQKFLATGQHLGIFKTPEDAENYARWLHEQQQQFYMGR